MIILGETKDGYIISLTSEEVAQLSGYSSRYSTGYTKPIIGSSINISELISRINSVEKLRDSLLNLKDKIHSINNSVTKGINLFSDITEIAKNDNSNKV